LSEFHIIGVMGPSKSGKDLVGDWFYNERDFIKVAFADPMKRFVRDIFMVSFEHLWGEAGMREIPMTFSEEEWLRFVSNFAKSANAFLADVVPQGDRVRSFMSLTEWLTDMRKYHIEHGHITMRYVLQTLGTEWGRRKVHPLLWVMYLYEKVVPKIKDGYLYTQEDGPMKKMDVLHAPPGILIPDHRFLNELVATQQNDGYVLRLRRLALEQENKVSNVGIEGHQSEVEMRDIPDDSFDLVLELEEGVEKVHEALEKAYEEEAWAKKRQLRGKDSSTDGQGGPAPTA
jgi:hypothetical protein